MFSQKLNRDDLFRWLAFAIIALAVFISYYPAIFFPPRADQVIYLAETVNTSPSSDLIFRNYDLNRHRSFESGDEILFRPLLYMILGLEQVVFGHNFWAWQILGLLAHLMLVWCLLRLLWRLSDGWLAFAGTWLFALSVTNYELVSWSHLNSYILMMVCIVLAIEQVVLCLQKNQLSWNSLVRLLIYLTIAVFIYETANLFALLIMGLLLISFSKLKRRALVLAGPVILYGLLSFYNYIFVNHLPIVTVGQGSSIGKDISSIFYLLSWWLYEGFFNGMYHYILAIRTIFRMDEIMVFKPLAFDNPQVVLQLMILSAFAGILWTHRRQFFQKMKGLSFFLAMIFFYAAVIVIGRQQGAGGVEGLQEAVRVNSYYLYIFWVLVLIMAYWLISKEPRMRTPRWLVIVFVCASLASGIWQGKRIYAMADGYSHGASQIVLLIRTLDLLVLEKSREPGFSFYVQDQYPGNYSLGVLRKKDDVANKAYSLAEVLYPQYIRSQETAKYKFLVKE